MSKKGNGDQGRVTKNWLYLLDVAFILFMLSISSYAVYASNVDLNLLVQEKLSVLGYACEADGYWGSQSENALRQYQTDRGLQVTGTLTEETIQELHLPDVLPKERLSEFPARPICLTSSEYDVNGSKEGGIGTGFLVGPHSMLTCAHVVYDESLGGLADQIEIIPEYYQGEMPLGTIRVTSVELMDEYLDSEKLASVLMGGNDHRYDIAILHFDENLGEQRGYFQVADESVNYTLTEALTIGYPVGVFCESKGNVSVDVKGVIYADDIFALPGSSGSPVLVLSKDGQNATAVGIVTMLMSGLETLDETVEDITGFDLKGYGLDFDSLGVTMGGSYCVSLNNSKIQEWMAGKIY